MTKKTKKEAPKALAINKTASREFEIISKLEAGVQLLGSEVKSIRLGACNLKESYVRVKNSEVFLLSCHIAPYSQAPVDAHEPTRERKLLLNKKEIVSLKNSIQNKGLTIIPLRMYLKNGKIKLEIATAKGKKLHDKRQDTKKKEAERHMKRALKIHS